MGKNMCEAAVLPNDVWGIIGSKLETASDRSRFRAVCKSWTSLIPFRQPPWLMLAEVNNDEDDEESPPPPPRGFVCLGEQKIHKVDFPVIHQARCVGSIGNWLITIHKDKTIRVLSPFSKLEFHLPSLSTFEYGMFRATDIPDDELSPEEHRDALVTKVVLSSSPDHNDNGHFIAMALHYHLRILAFATPGDPSWTTVQPTDSPLLRAIGVQDIIFYKQKFYAITFQARLIVCDIQGGAPSFSYLTPSLTDTSPTKHRYLVECSGELLLVIKFLDANFNLEQVKPGDPVYTTNRFQLYKLDFTSMKFNELKTLGDHSLFLGLNTSIAVRSSDYHGLLKTNCIYFTDDYRFGYRGTGTPGGHDMGVFHLEDNTITPHYNGRSLSLYSPPLWIFPA